MTIAVHMCDVLEPVQADEDFTSALNAMNMAAAQGKQFMVVEGMDGTHIALNIPNVNMFVEIDD